MLCDPKPPRILTHLFDGHGLALGSELKSLRAIFGPQNCSVLGFPVAFLLKNREYEHIFVSILSDEVLVKFAEEIFVIPGTFSIKMKRLSKIQQS